MTVKVIWIICLNLDLNEVLEYVVNSYFGVLKIVDNFRLKYDVWRRVWRCGVMKFTLSK